MKNHSALLLSARVLAAAPIVTLVAVVALPRNGGRIALGACIVAVIGLLAILVAGWRHSLGAATCVGIGAATTTGALVYLASLDPGGAEIPLGGVGGLFVGLILLVVGAPNLRDPSMGHGPAVPPHDPR